MNVNFVAADLPRLILRRARLFARVHRPHQLIEGESYRVDLSVPCFEILWAGEPASVARAQLVATHVPAVAEWLWGFENPSIAKAGTDELRVAMGQVPQLGELLEGRAWTLDSDAAFDLAAWIAERTGYEAMYPAIVGDATAFLALTFVEHHGEPFEGLARWCLGCGELASRLSVPVVQGPDGRSLCATCAENAFSSLDDHEEREPGFLARDPGDEPPDAPLADYVCAFCERRRPRLMMPETALCWWCLDRARKAMRCAM
ncbi:MAG: hypothetical protein E6J41_06870 [Chloroflexi bacterium]|nr:MAG: hypothetical protein E6J41_06870 [Chloroflexota bacterium]